MSKRSIFVHNNEVPAFRSNTLLSRKRDSCIEFRMEGGEKGNLGWLQQWKNLNSYHPLGTDILQA